jgi:phage terminase large subunit-like protein
MTKPLLDRDKLHQLRERVLAGDVTAREAREVMARLATLKAVLSLDEWDPYPWQIPPRPVPTMGTWLLLGGRGTGKTEGAARYMNAHALGPPCDERIPGGHRMAIVAPTLGDAGESAVGGPSGLLAVNPAIRWIGGIGGTRVMWPNQSSCRLFGAFSKEDIERTRSGGNRCLVWLEEAAAMRYLDAIIEHTSLGLRIGHRPHFICSTTPKPRHEIKAMLASEFTVITRGSTRDAHHLDPVYRQRLFERYEGTRLGRQELDAELLEDVEGALWSWALIDAARVPAIGTPERIVVAIDPPGTNAVGREAGIVVVGRIGGEAYVLSDLSGEYTPNEWAAAAVSAYRRWNADAIVAETNFGGDMVVSTIRSIEQTADIPIVRVTARGTKQQRAEPVVALYEQRRVHHVGVLSALETQLTEWTPDTPESPDRLDALVHGITHLLLLGGPALVTSAPASRRFVGSIEAVTR